MTSTRSKVLKPTLTGRVAVADHGVFRVERLSYAGFPRDVFVFQVPDWCNVIAETTEGEILLVRQYRFGTDALSLEIPGGVIDRGEDPAAAAARELLEETGHAAGSIELLTVVEPNPALQGNRCFTFLARDVRHVGPTRFDDLEELELVKVTRDELPGLIDRGEISHALIALALETYLRRGR